MIMLLLVLLSIRLTEGLRPSAYLRTQQYSQVKPDKVSNKLLTPSIFGQASLTLSTSFPFGEDSRKSSGFSMRLQESAIDEATDVSKRVSVKRMLLNKLYDKTDDIYVCPATLTPLVRCERYIGLSQQKYLYNPTNNIKYDISPRYYDLTIKEEVEKPIWSQSLKESFNSRFFQTKLISSIYERGYRQNFVNFGFPGIDKEYAEATELFDAANAKRILDLSCGSGFMTRKFIQSGKYDRIISADLSPTMLAETKSRIEQEKLSLPELVRCDSARLPFQDESFDAIHAGAAMHCWPRVEVALKEIYRVLKPGGVFFTTTIITNTNASPRRQSAPFNVFPSVSYLVDLFEVAGFKNETGQVIGRQEGRGCAVLKAVKGEASGPVQELFNK